MSDAVDHLYTKALVPSGNYNSDTVPASGLSSTYCTEWHCVKGTYKHIHGCHRCSITEQKQHRDTFSCSMCGCATLISLNTFFIDFFQVLAQPNSFLDSRCPICPWIAWWQHCKTFNQSCFFSFSQLLAFTSHHLRWAWSLSKTLVKSLLDPTWVHPELAHNNTHLFLFTFFFFQTRITAGGVFTLSHRKQLWFLLNAFGKPFSNIKQFKGEEGCMKFPNL